MSNDSVLAIWETLKGKVLELIKKELSRVPATYRAVVITPPNTLTGLIEVQRPFDKNTLLLPFSSAVSNVVAGDQVQIFVPRGGDGNMNNAVVVQNGNWTLGGSASLGAKNLLHNWDFRNPVNQRGDSSYSGPVAYCIDRWIRYEKTTVAVAGGYITLTSADTISSYFFQRLERLVLGTYTLSINVDGTIMSCTLVWDGSTRVEQSIIFGSRAITLGLTIDYGYPTFFILPKTVGAFNIYAVKLELGPVSTLANDPPADYGEELRKCQRYFYRTGVNGFANAVVFDGNGSVYGMANVRFPVTMRIAPTVTFYSTAGTQGKITNWGSGLDFADVSVHSVTGVGKDGFGVIQASTALLAGNAYTFHYEANADL